MKVEYKDIIDIVNTLTFKYAVIEDTTTTICKAVLPNGFTVGTGEAACLDPNNFDLELGKKYAQERAIVDATNELWKLEGYLLKTTGKVSKDF